MRLHTDRLAPSDVHRATTAAGMTGVFAVVTVHGSRSRARGLEVKLTGTSSRRPNSGGCGAGGDYAATWDEWGMFLAALYELDPEMIAGSPSRPAYASRAAFHAATHGRFLTLTADAQHGRAGHKWGPSGDGNRARRECTTCDALVDYTYMHAPVADVERALADERGHTYGVPFFDEPYTADPRFTAAVAEAL